jgi:hypothetical protein
LACLGQSPAPPFITATAAPPALQIVIHRKCGDGLAIEAVLQNIEALKKQQALRDVIASRISPARAHPSVGISAHRVPLCRQWIPVYNPRHSHPARALMAADKTSTMWVPVCCGRVMRCNMFRQADGGAYAALVCTVCNKNVTLEQEPATAADTFGDGSSILSLIGSPKPPKTERKKSFAESSPDDPTL